MKLRQATEKDWKVIQSLNNKLFIHDFEDYSIELEKDL